MVDPVLPPDASTILILPTHVGTNRRGGRSSPVARLTRKYHADAVLLTEIQSPQGFAAETASTTVILTSAHLGFALSTTQVASGSILGAGLGRKLAEVRWGIAGRMVAAWLITLPAAALVGGISASAVKHGGNFGTVVVALVGAAVAAGIVLLSRRNPVGAHNVNDAHEVTLRTEPPARVGTAA